jgi:hypothetical protein
MHYTFCDVRVFYEVVVLRHRSMDTANKKACYKYGKFNDSIILKSYLHAISKTKTGVMEHVEISQFT